METLAQLKTYFSLQDRLPELKALVYWGDAKIPDEMAKDSKVYTFKQFLEVGKKVEDAVIHSICEKQRPGQCCVIIYTSGTTGKPKGVMLSHDNIIFNGTSLASDFLSRLPTGVEVFPYQMRFVSYLPLSHIAGLQFDLTSHIL